MSLVIVPLPATAPSEVFMVNVLENEKQIAKPHLTVICNLLLMNNQGCLFKWRTYRLWDEGVLNDNVMEEWKSEHMRTPYKQ